MAKRFGGDCLRKVSIVTVEKDLAVLGSMAREVNYRGQVLFECPMNVPGPGGEKAE